MIIAHEGTPGSGKSYDAAKKILDNLSKKRRVLTNIDGMDDPRCRRALQDMAGLEDTEFADLFYNLKNEDVPNFWLLDICTPGSMIVIDEAHKFFNSRTWQKEENQAFSDWCSTHRHQGFDVILISQKVTKIDKQACSNIEWSYRYRKLNFFGGWLKKGYQMTSYSGVEDTDPVARQVRYYDAKIFRTYQSYAAKDIKELGLGQTVNILKHPVFILIPLVVIFTVFMFTRSGMSKGDLFGSGDPAKRLAAAKAAIAVPAEPKSIKDIPRLGSPAGQVPAAGTSGPAPALAPAPPAIQGQHYAFASPAPEKRLVAVIDGKKIYKCGGRFCEN